MLFALTWFCALYLCAHEYKKKMNIYILFVLGITLMYCVLFFLQPESSTINAHNMLRLLPFPLILSYTLVRWCDTIRAGLSKGIFVIILVAGVVLFTNSFYASRANFATNEYKLPDIVIEVVEVIRADAIANDIEEKRVVFSIQNGLYEGSFYNYVRQLDSSILMPIGGSRNNLFAISEEANEILEILNRARRGSRLDGNQLEYLLKQERVNYFVAWRYTPGLETLRSRYRNVAEFSEHIVFRADSFDDFPTEFEGVDYRMVFDYHFYLERYVDVEEDVGSDPNAVLEHFVTIGIPEGRQGSATFNVEKYRFNYPNVTVAFGGETHNYYIHFIERGHYEGRIASRFIPSTMPKIPEISPAIFEGIDYGVVFDHDFYFERYEDVYETVGSDFDAVLEHFVTVGMLEGRQGNELFDVVIYMQRYTDLVAAFGSDLSMYYIHFATFGFLEGRVALEETPRDYTIVFDFNYFIEKNSVVAYEFKNDPDGALLFFINVGMDQGLRGSHDFDVFYYKERYPELVELLGEELSEFYIHYMDYGRSEGRIAFRLPDL